MEFREKILPSGTRIWLGKDENSNDKLMKKFQGKGNTILHTSSPGSPFCVIDKLNPTKSEINLSGSICVAYSQDWRDNKQDTKINVFTGKDIKKSFWMKKGTWKVRKSKTIKIKKQDISRIK